MFSTMDLGSSAAKDGTAHNSATASAAPGSRNFIAHIPPDSLAHANSLTRNLRLSISAVGHASPTKREHSGRNVDMTGSEPAVRPARPFFSSGPCAKRPGWTLQALDSALLGRSHRSKPGKAKLKDAIER